MRRDDVRVGDLRIAYAEAGEGPSLILLHGGWSDSRIWRRQLDALARDFAVAAWDAPGCGLSSDPPADWRMADYADCLAAWLEAVGSERPHVIGLSWGGALALELYRRHPQVPASLVLAGAYAGWAGSLPPDVVAERLERVLREIELPPEEWVSAYIPGFFTEAAPAGLVEEIEAMMCNLHPAGTRVMLQAMAEADLRDVLPWIRVPTLLLYGELDQRSPLHIAEELHAAIPSSRLVVLPGVGHLACAERPDEFNEAVRAFALRGGAGG
ncbi:MAG TPA: alpha/beta hydrolase [Gaiellaceae bacterium]|nr:alpha/beta hydrolase [Gaiellaceae bacterium]